MLSPCHHRHAMLSSRLRTVSTLSPRGHHASVTAMPMLSRRHTLATSPPHGCRCSLTSRGRRRRQPHPPHLSCTSSLVSFSSLHRAARARFSRIILLVRILVACARDRCEVARRRRSTTSWERVGCKRASASACAGGRGDGTPKHERASMRRGAPAGVV